VKIVVCGGVGQKDESGRGYVGRTNETLALSHDREISDWSLCGARLHVYI
jgi:hypothetical protein